MLRYRQHNWWFLIFSLSVTPPPPNHNIASMGNCEISLCELFMNVTVRKSLDCSVLDTGLLQTLHFLIRNDTKKRRKRGKGGGGRKRKREKFAIKKCAAILTQFEGKFPKSYLCELWSSYPKRNPSNLSQGVTFMTCIRKVTGSNLCRVTGYPHWSFTWVSIHAGKHWD
jgi:hypothetical protein